MSNECHKFTKKIILPRCFLNLFQYIPSLYLYLYLCLCLCLCLCPLPFVPCRHILLIEMRICISDYRKVPTKAAFCHHIPFLRRYADFPCYLSRFTKVRYHNDVPRGSVPAVRSHSSRYSPYRLADFLTRFYRADNDYHKRL